MDTTNETKAGNPVWLKLVQQQVGSLRFGVVQIVVHENRVVQIERTEKIRLDKDTQTFPRLEFANQKSGG